MFRVRHVNDPVGVRFDTATQAIRGMARAVRGLPLTPAERRAFAYWYTHRNYRSVAMALRSWHRYEISVSVGGTRQTFVIEPLPVMPKDPIEYASVYPPADVRDGSETPGKCPPVKGP